MTNNVKKQNGWAMRLFTAVCENISSWILNHELVIAPDESLTFMIYHSLGWEEAMMYQTMARVKQVKDEVA
jgi:hypothetical protein